MYLVGLHIYKVLCYLLPLILPHVSLTYISPASSVVQQSPGRTKAMTWLCSSTSHLRHKYYFQKTSLAAQSAPAARIGSMLCKPVVRIFSCPHPCHMRCPSYLPIQHSLYNSSSSVFPQCDRPSIASRTMAAQYHTSGLVSFCPYVYQFTIH